MPRKGRNYATERCITSFLKESRGAKLSGTVNLAESLKNVSAPGQQAGAPRRKDM